MNDKNNTRTYTNKDIEVVYNLVNYYKMIPNYATITELLQENAEYIKEALPNVISCYSMLSGCKALTFIDTTGWDTSKIEIMECMFIGCEALASMDTTGWDTSSVIYMSCMFFDCNKLTMLDVSNWDTSNVTDMNSMFYDCKALTTLDISDWDTSKVTNMGHMFYDCISLTTIKGVIDMKSCTSYNRMFYNCTNLTGVKIKNPPPGVTATSGIGGLDASKYTIVS